MLASRRRPASRHGRNGTEPRLLFGRNPVSGDSGTGLEGVVSPLSVVAAPCMRISSGRASATSSAPRASWRKRGAHRIASGAQYPVWTGRWIPGSARTRDRHCGIRSASHENPHRRYGRGQSSPRTEKSAARHASTLEPPAARAGAGHVRRYRQTRSCRGSHVDKACRSRPSGAGPALLVEPRAAVRATPHVHRRVHAHPLAPTLSLRARS